MPRHASLLVAIASLAGVAACGGSGSGGGNPVPSLGQATLAETYFAVLEAGSTASGVDARATTGTLTSDGAGNAYHTQVTNDDGTITGPETLTYEYDVAADGGLELRAGALLLARGGVRADGRCAIVGSAAPGSLPGIIALLRREGAHTPADLSGRYHFVEFTTPTLGSRTVTVTGPMDFDGAGGATGSFTINQMGGILTAPPTAFTYEVDGDGTSRLSIGVSLEGGVAEGGEIAVWGGATETFASPSIAAAVRAAGSAGDSTLQGSYWIVLLDRDPSSGEFRSLHGTATSDGAGSITLETSTSNTNGVIAVEPPQTTTYEIDPDGTLTVDAGGSKLVGGVTEDGRFAVLGGGFAAGSSPTIAFLCRR